MKKLFFIILFFSSLGFNYAQEQGDFRLQLGADYRLRINEVGANAGIEYLFVDNFSIAPNFSYYFPDFGRISNLNVDLRYYLTQGVSQVYILGGYNNYWENFQPGLPGQSRTRPGGNFGAGAFFDVGETLGFITEFKIQSQNTRIPVLRLGVVMTLGGQY
ncbi:MAG: hypothetical protein EA341_03555 [Mongoliibacter sp.]|uniref:hypothetical protein n=1 Tax=Mongoliibacter sp. TaxID=2022438 RepID=UPI0012EF2B3C|nr:hypothetical protein [Mongoliibacter sp.]TVP52236.1 MAG: hypothetical protein EA341_03555 [Mongoliibacter sp.]